MWSQIPFQTFSGRTVVSAGLGFSNLVNELTAKQRGPVHPTLLVFPCIAAFSPCRQGGMYVDSANKARGKRYDGAAVRKVVGLG